MEDLEKGTFGYDLMFLSQKDKSLIVLKSKDEKSQIIVSANYQGKVFTSTTNGLSGNSNGYVGYKAFNAPVPDEHMNGYGGENRFWLGPEGGRYSVYFKPESEQVFDNWHTPKPLDTEAWDIVRADNQNVILKKDMEVMNYLGTKLKLRVDRTISLIERSGISSLLGFEIGEKVKTVAYETQNAIINLNDFAWSKESGTICIWMLDMFIPTPDAVTIVPFVQGDDKELGKIVTSDYFGEIPANRLKVTEGLIYLKTDGKYRSKIGLNGKRTTGIAGNYDPTSKRLTVITFNKESGATYLNQEWNPGKDPLQGDALNAYNDGPLEDGSIMGPFLELESVSPAAFLEPSQLLTHKHVVYHFTGEEKDLDSIVQNLFGVSIKTIKEQF
jgi:hypothetical protein